MNKTPQKGAFISSDDNIRVVIRNFFAQAIAKDIFDAVLMPMRVPSSDSYAWILIKDNRFFG